VRYEGDGRIFKIGINVEYNTVRMLRYHNSVKHALSFDPVSSEMVLETLVYSQFNHLTRLLSREYFIEFGRREIFKLLYSLSC